MATSSETLFNISLNSLDISKSDIYGSFIE